MSIFFFDLVGELPAKDVRGHECCSRREAKEHATFIANRIGTERPSFIKPGNCIKVRDHQRRFFVQRADQVNAPFSSILDWDLGLGRLQFRIGYAVQGSFTSLRESAEGGPSAFRASLDAFCRPLANVVLFAQRGSRAYALQCNVHVCQRAAVKAFFGHRLTPQFVRTASSGS